LMVSDGKEMMMVNEQEKQVMRVPAPGPNPDLRAGPGGIPIQYLFFNPQGKLVTGSSKYQGTKKVAGVTYQVVRGHIGGGGTAPNATLYFGPSGLPEGVEFTESPQEKLTLWVRGIRLNAPLKPEQVAYTPPHDFTEPQTPDKSMLPVGKEAPDFLLPRPGGNQLALTDALKGKKAVLVNFWFYG
jgi:hypothetical protein